MKSLPDFFADIPDPRRAQGRRHHLSTVLAISAAATLCGMRGYLAISDWAKSLGQKARERFGCRYKNRRYIVPSLSISTMPYNVGTRSMLSRTRAWPSMEKPCATPSTITAIKLTS
jgi:hypothetical protein